MTLNFKTRSVKTHLMKMMHRFVLILGISLLVEDVLACGDVDQDQESLSLLHRVRRQIDVRESCQPGASVPVTRVNTTERLKALRKQMKEFDVDAYFIGSKDSHLSEKTSPPDQRLQWITGFSGSNGFAVITQEKAAMWSDGRYLLQAEGQLDCNWEFSQGSESGDNNWLDWLALQFPQPNAILASDPTLYSAVVWLGWQDYAGKNGMEIRPLKTNLIDEVWTERPERSKAPLHVHELQFAGESWQDKLHRVREELANSGIDAMVVSALDEVAWLFNLRGEDFPTVPMFYSYAIVTRNQTVLYISPERHTEEVQKHLNTDGCDSDKDCVQLSDYNAAFSHIKDMFEQQRWTKVLLGKPWAYTSGATYAVYKLIPSAFVEFKNSPIMMMKAQKNEVEIKGMKSANIRDAVALIEMASEVEHGMANGENWTELKVAKKLEKLRSQQKHFKSNSFHAISAYGPNGAIIHYIPTNKTDAKIGTDSLFLLDSGGQYLDGTTDVTRTFSYGEPTEFMKEAYTRVLAGAIDLARATFPDGTPETRLDILARWNLMRVGLNYNHGTGHGIGAYGLVHESPTQVRIYKEEEHPMRQGYFFSDEPGYYDAGNFGIRLETVLMAVNRDNLKYGDKPVESGGGKQMLGFEPVCLVPFEPKLINMTLLNHEQKAWLNNYNNKIREKVGAEMKKQNKSNRAIEWMMKRTEPVM